MVVGEGTEEPRESHVRTYRFGSGFADEVFEFLGFSL
jgi:hypothetical protein